ncbi:ATP-binding protein [Phycisphaera mikurensis]|uniref:AAA+ ATPase domain-containing protein n=1 Tax=Phycisphaera mikurensis (strain NBRC 102666 / KCTC 22515 / FYK2301M01) TaxID=1142394 RepID=I0IAN9_PHYMF|nr:ATP-binding protein [Phycisphaera mikurensis]MBB6441678.1 hypothetical protein [Phycisphaera mikurensis]BAM02327.1 hypothetical protein PSMK_01680 [Phycisphaera mikurensis NBRC 102666]
MDAASNPFEPGAGNQPPELAGRDEVREKVRIALERAKRGRSARGLILPGLRGVGKTVLLRQIGRDAAAAGGVVVTLEAPEQRSLPALLIPQLRVALLQLSRVAAAKEHAERAMRVLTGFTRALRVKYQDIEVSLSGEAEEGFGDNGDLEQDLQTLLVQVGAAAAAARKPVLILIDELQYVKVTELGALLSASHRLSQEALPVMLIGAGLPQLLARMAKAKSYAERLFEYPRVDALPEEAARRALVKPAADEGAAFEEEALAEILRQTRGYPYFLQEWGKHAWDFAERSPITLDDVVAASAAAVLALDEGFFRVRLDRVTPMERRYLRAMAELGEGPHRSGDVAEQMNRSLESLGSTRDKLIRKGMIWSPAYAEIAFTVPMFDRYLKRVIPDAEADEEP